MWLCSTFSNEPSNLSRYSGYIEGLKALGLVVAFGIDSNHIAFLTEGAAYFSMMIAGLLLCLISALTYTKDTKYGDEEFVIIPEVFEVDQSSLVSGPEVEKSETTVVVQEES